MHLKTEHAGAKNGGGFYGTREEAKTLSKKRRRRIDRRETVTPPRIRSSRPGG